MTWQNIHYPTYPAVPEEPLPHYLYPRGRSSWSILIPSGRDVTNLATNPGFERGLDGWQLDTAATVTRTTDDAHSGAYSMRFIANAAGAIYDFSADYQLGRQYTACIWAKGPRGSGVYWDWVPGVPFFSDSRTAMTGEWVRLTATIPARNTPTFTNFFNILVEGQGPFYFDDFMIAEGDFCPTWFDGDAPGATWSGAPHASSSTLSRFSTYGPKVNLTDMGFNLISDGGWGMGPLDLVTTTIARAGGVNVQRQRPGQRTLTFTGTWSGTPCDVAAGRQTLIDAVLYKFYRQCTAPVILCYQHLDGCGDPVGRELQLPVYYVGGLEGNRTQHNINRAIIQFATAQQSAFCETADRAVVLPPSGVATINYEGTDDAFVTLEMRGQVTMENVVNLTTGVPVTFDSGPGSMFIGANEYVILRTTPGEISMTHYPTGNSLMNFIDFGASQPAQLRLVPGENQISFDGSTQGGEVVLRWRNCHHGVDAAIAGEWCAC